MTDSTQSASPVMLRISLGDSDGTLLKAEPIDTIPVRKITRGARLSQRPLRIDHRKWWSRYRLTCFVCNRSWSIEVQLRGFSCSALFKHPECHCRCGRGPRCAKWLGWVA